MEQNVKEALCKKLIIGAYIGQTVICRNDLHIERNIFHRIKGTAFLVTGIVGRVSDGVIREFDVILDSLSDGQDMTVTGVDFAQNFVLGR